MNIKNDLNFHEDLNNLVNKKKILLENLDLLTKNFEEYDSDFKKHVNKHMIYNQKEGDVEFDSVNSLLVNYNYKLLVNLLKDKNDGIESLYKHIRGVEIYKQFDEAVKEFKEKFINKFKEWGCL